MESAKALNNAEFDLEAAVEAYVAAEQNLWLEWRDTVSPDQYYKELVRVARSNRGQTSSSHISATNLIQRIKREVALTFLDRMEREGWTVTVAPPKTSAT